MKVGNFFKLFECPVFFEWNISPFQIYGKLLFHLLMPRHNKNWKKYRRIIVTINQIEVSIDLNDKEKIANPKDLDIIDAAKNYNKKGKEKRCYKKRQRKDDNEKADDSSNQNDDSNLLIIDESFFSNTLEDDNDTSNEFYDIYGFDQF